MNSIHQKPIKPEDVKCIFCEGNHWSSKCTQVVTKDDRIAILTDKRKGYCTDCWAKTHPGSTCQPKYLCKDAAC